MDLNSIKLTPQLTAELYANTLVETTFDTIPQPRPIRYLGDNQKHILIVTANASVAFLTDNELAFLTNILTACKLSMADVAIINKEQYAVADYTEVLDFLQSKTVLLFGVDPLAFGLPINFPHFQLQTFHLHTYLYAPKLEEIEQDKNIKAQLWTALKTLFGI